MWETYGSRIFDFAQFSNPTIEHSWAWNLVAAPTTQMFSIQESHSYFGGGSAAWGNVQMSSLSIEGTALLPGFLTDPRLTDENDPTQSVSVITRENNKYSCDGSVANASMYFNKNYVVDSKGVLPSDISVKDVKALGRGGVETIGKVRGGPELGLDGSYVQSFRALNPGSIMWTVTGKYWVPGTWNRIGFQRTGVTRVTCGGASVR
jgi:hypothetical protein